MQLDVHVFQLGNGCLLLLLRGGVRRLLAGRITLRLPCLHELQQQAIVRRIAIGQFAHRKLQRALGLVCLRVPLEVVAGDAIDEGAAFIADAVEVRRDFRIALRHRKIIGEPTARLIVAAMVVVDEAADADRVVAVERLLVAVDVGRGHGVAEDVVPGPPEADVAIQSAGVTHLFAEEFEIPVDGVIRVRHPVERAARIELLDPKVQLIEQMHERGAVIVVEAFAGSALLVEFEFNVVAFEREEGISGLLEVFLPLFGNVIDIGVTGIEPAAARFLRRQQSPSFSDCAADRCRRRRRCGSAPSDLRRAGRRSSP